VIIIEYWPEKRDFIHMTILRAVFYLVIFLLWVYWEEKYRYPKKRKKKN
jgi:hypothetical protein